MWSSRAEIERRMKYISKTGGICMGYYASALVIFSIIFCFILYNIVFRSKSPKYNTKKYLQRQRKPYHSTKSHNHKTRVMMDPTPQTFTKKSYVSISGNIIYHPRFQRTFLKTISVISIRRLFVRPKNKKADVLPFQTTRRTGQESEEVQL